MARYADIFDIKATKKRSKTNGTKRTAQTKRIDILTFRPRAPVKRPKKADKSQLRIIPVLPVDRTVAMAKVALQRQGLLGKGKRASKPRSGAKGKSGIPVIGEASEIVIIR